MRIWIVGCMMAMGMLVTGCGRKPVPPVPSAPAVAAPQIVPNIAPDTPAPAPAPDLPTNLRPVHVTVCEHTAPAANAQVWIESFNPSSIWWSARSDAAGRATLLVPLQYTAFRVNAIKLPYALVATNISNLPKTTAPLELALTLLNTGVVITAQISAARPILLSNLTVRIQPSNTASLTITLPFAATWNARFELNLAGTSVGIAHAAKENTATLDVSNLPEGTYRVYLYGRSSDARTNMQCTVNLARDAHATITF